MALNFFFNPYHLQTLHKRIDPPTIFRPTWKPLTHWPETLNKNHHPRPIWPPRIWLPGFFGNFVFLRFFDLDRYSTCFLVWVPIMLRKTFPFQVWLTSSNCISDGYGEIDSKLLNVNFNLPQVPQIAMFEKNIFSKRSFLVSMWNFGVYASLCLMTHLESWWFGLVMLCLF